MELITYDKFINNILETRGRFACGYEYHERHHIVPRCMGGTNSKTNLIDLFAREHFIAHKLLAQENPNNKGLTYAWGCMAFVKRDDTDRYELTSEEYEEVKIAISHAHKGENNQFYGKRHSEETRIKMRESHISEEAPLAKLTEEDVICILRMLCSYASITDIKNIYNISDVTIRNIKNKKRWGYLYEKYTELYNFPNLPQRHSKSIKNKSGVTGVSWSEKRNKWKSVLIFKGKTNYLGYFKNKDDAIKARLLAEIKYYGEHAPQKHLFCQYGINGGENELPQ